MGFYEDKWRLMGLLVIIGMSLNPSLYLIPCELLYTPEVKKMHFSCVCLFFPVYSLCSLSLSDSSLLPPFFI